MVEQLQQYITSYDLVNLREYWNFLNSRLFCRLEQRFMTSVRKLEVGLLKLYLVNAAQKNKSDKIREFFEKMTDTLQNQPEFKEWFGTVNFLPNTSLFNPLPHMPILGSSNSAANKALMSKILTNGNTIF